MVNKLRTRMCQMSMLLFFILKSIRLKKSKGIREWQPIYTTGTIWLWCYHKTYDHCHFKSQWGFWKIILLPYASYVLFFFPPLRTKPIRLGLDTKYRTVGLFFHNMALYQILYITLQSFEKIVGTTCLNFLVHLFTFVPR